MRSTLDVSKIASQLIGDADEWSTQKNGQMPRKRTRSICLQREQSQSVGHTQSKTTYLNTSMVNIILFEGGRWDKGMKNRYR